MKPSFHNTVGEVNPELGVSEKKAESQESIILAFFEKYDYLRFGPSYIFIELNQVWPITSVRRAITNLTAQDKLVKTAHQVKGIYGKKEFCWQLKPKKGKSLFD